MKLTNDQAYTAFMALAQLSRVKMPAKGAVRVKVMLAALRPVAEAVDTARVEALKELGTLRDQGQYQLDPEAQKEFAERMKEMLEDSVEVSVEALRVADLGNAEVQPMWLEQLGPLVALEA